MVTQVPGDWVDAAIRVQFLSWLDSDDGFPDGGSGDGLVYIQDDMEAAYRAGYFRRQDEC